MVQTNVRHRHRKGSVIKPALFRLQAHSGVLPVLTLQSVLKSLWESHISIDKMVSDGTRSLWLSSCYNRQISMRTSSAPMSCIMLPMVRRSSSRQSWAWQPKSKCGNIQHVTGAQADWSDDGRRRVLVSVSLMVLAGEDSVLPDQGVFTLLRGFERFVQDGCPCSTL